MSLRDKLLKNSTIKETSTLTDSKIYGKGDMITTPIPMINAAFSGSINGGFTPGLTMLAAPSKHFKSGFSLLLARSFLDKYPDGMILFYDSEFGTPQSYFSSFGVDTDSVIHTPITDVEQLKFDLTKQIEQLDREDRVLIIVDSVGNLASKKEVDDAMAEKSVADMSRAKQLKSLFRIVTPHLTIKDIPLIVVNHTYLEIALFPKQIVGGGTGAYYSASTIWVIGRQQDKDTTGVKGYNFIINIEKSRYVQEKSKFPITVNWEGGIKRWSGMIDVALEHGSVIKAKKGYVASADDPEKPVREKTIADNTEFWEERLKNTDLAAFIEKKYKSPDADILQDDQ